MDTTITLPELEHDTSEASMQAYSDESRADDPYALPDVEVFYRTAAAIRADEWRDEDGEYMGEGWYAWSCFPGCLPDSDPAGPFLTAQEALDAMRD